MLLGKDLYYIQSWKLCEASTLDIFLDQILLISHPFQTEAKSAIFEHLYLF